MYVSNDVYHQDEAGISKLWKYVYLSLTYIHTVKQLWTLKFILYIKCMLCTDTECYYTVCMYILYACTEQYMQQIILYFMLHPFLSSLEGCVSVHTWTFCKTISLWYNLLMG
jgi:hypothetical protein